MSIIVDVGPIVDSLREVVALAFDLDLSQVEIVTRGVVIDGAPVLEVETRIRGMAAPEAVGAFVEGLFAAARRLAADPSIGESELFEEARRIAKTAR